MGKANQVKVALRDVVEMVDLIQTLKDVADNKFFTLMSQKETFRRFGETFTQFFRLISFMNTKHPLISNDHSTTGIVVITVSGSFLGEFNNKTIRLALEQKMKHQNVKFIAVGEKSMERLSKESSDIKLFEDVEARGFYETAILIKDYLVEEVMAQRLGKVMVCYSWPKNFDTQKPRSIKLLPCDDLVTKQSQFTSEYEHIIEESDPSDVVGFLSNLWVTTRLYEILVDTYIASAAAQSAFLEDSVDKMKKERVKASMKYRKARKSDIDKSLRETFSARMMSMK